MRIFIVGADPVLCWVSKSCCGLCQNPVVVFVRILLWSWLLRSSQAHRPAPYFPPLPWVWAVACSLGFLRTTTVMWRLYLCQLVCWCVTSIGTGHLPKASHTLPFLKLFHQLCSSGPSSCLGNSLILLHSVLSLSLLCLCCVNTT